LATNVKINIPTEIIVKPITGSKGEIVNLKAILTNTSNQQIISGKIIQFFINGTSIGNAITNSNGIATLSYNISQNSGYYYMPKFWCSL
jgi:predicted ATP-grasp superfamily ATP-dependent carboligase